MNARQKAKHFKMLYEASIGKVRPVKVVTDEKQVMRLKYKIDVPTELFSITDGTDEVAALDACVRRKMEREVGQAVLNALGSAHIEPADVFCGEAALALDFGVVDLYEADNY